MDIDSAPGHVALRGRVTTAAAADIRAAVQAAIEAAVSPNVTLDVRHAVIRDTAGIGLLIGAHRHAERHGRTLLISGASLGLRHLLSRAGMMDILHLTSPAEEYLSRGSVAHGDGAHDARPLSA